MRANEFITEVTGHGKMSKRQNYATKGLNVFSDGTPFDGDYTLNRVMMAVACADGVNKVEIPKHSWAGRYKTAHPYTKEEQEMLKAAYKAAGANWEDINCGDMDSDELESTHSTSPIKPFKGYKK